MKCIFYVVALNVVNYLLWYSTKSNWKSGLNHDNPFTAKGDLLNKIDKDKNTALHLALKLQRIKIARKLLIHGADIFLK